MTEVVVADPNQISEWVGSRIPHVGGDDFGPSQGFAVVNDDKILAGVVYHDWSEKYGTIQLSMAADSPMWAKRPIIAALLHYPFQQIGCHRVFTLTPIDNKMAIRVNSHIGFQREAVCHSSFGKDKHAVVMRMLKPDYQKLYVSETNGQFQRR